MNDLTFLDERYVEYQNPSGTWVNITPYVIQKVSGEWGIQGTQITDKLANTGMFTIVLNNEDGLFTPGLSTALNGFKKGAVIRHRLVYEEEEVIKYRAYIDEIAAEPLNYGDKRATIKCVDWMDYAAEHSLEGFNIDTNQRIDEATRTLIADMNNSPQDTLYYSGSSTLPTVFDGIRDGTKVYSEMSKLVQSELGWTYVQKHWQTGERLVVEGRTTRDGSAVASIFQRRANSEVLLLHSGTSTPYLALNDNLYLLLNRGFQPTFLNSLTDVEQKHGVNFINEARMTSYPRKVDDTLQVLYSSPQRIALAAGETKDSLKITYKDPTGGDARVNADPDTMVVPVSGTDFDMFLNEDGTGTNLTASLSVTPVFAPEGVTFSITNSGGTDGWVYVRFRGYGIYIQDPLTYIINDAASITSYKKISSITINQPYLADAYLSAGLGATIVYQYNEARTELVAIRFIANTNDELMRCFLFLDVGDRVPITDDANEINDDYFIQNAKYSIDEGGMIDVKYGLVSSLSLSGNFWLVEIVGRSEVEINTIVGY
jgi:hypothetical protein